MDHKLRKFMVQKQPVPEPRGSRISVSKFLTENYEHFPIRDRPSINMTRSATSSRVMDPPGLYQVMVQLMAPVHIRLTTNGSASSTASCLSRSSTSIHNCP